MFMNKILEKKIENLVKWVSMSVITEFEYLLDKCITEKISQHFQLTFMITDNGNELCGNL